MVRALAISLIFLAGLAALGALFVARRVLRRIDAMNRSAHAIMAGDLSQRLPVSGSGDELDRLALGLNQMLARIGDLMAGLREVSDNIAHDLRTPLTRLRNHAEEALRLDREKPEYRAALERTIEESDGLIRIFDALLMIARAEAGADRAGMSDFDVGAVVLRRRRALRAGRRGERLRAHGRRGARPRRRRQSRTDRPGDRQSRRQCAKIWRGARRRRAKNEVAVDGAARGRKDHDRGRRPRTGRRRGRSSARVRPLRAAGGRALAPRLRARPVARRRRGAHAWRRVRLEDNRAGAEGRRRAAGRGAIGRLPSPSPAPPQALA